jgi:hypothetical protein
MFSMQVSGSSCAVAYARMCSKCPEGLEIYWGRHLQDRAGSMGRPTASESQRGVVAVEEEEQQQHLLGRVVKGSAALKVKVVDCQQQEQQQG